jgi:uncharacterized protein YaaQ
MRSARAIAVSWNRSGGSTLSAKAHFLEQNNNTLSILVNNNSISNSRTLHSSTCQQHLTVCLRGSTTSKATNASSKLKILDTEQSSPSKDL